MVGREGTEYIVGKIDRDSLGVCENSGFIGVYFFLNTHMHRKRKHLFPSIPVQTAGPLSLCVSEAFFMIEPFRFLFSGSFFQAYTLGQWFSTRGSWPL